ncbi:flagellar export chaperone FliS [Dasania sp. GY-MA-18]|uniref:Flagellar secretion chaperone FliS n=1 Tax=Dasania phycosphaerae TaxID=2950436 RepID=A0A9J6RHJ3_9GAMM|nr:MULTISPECIES: flagellar export chaperone FliS [Dasania]MCR8921381.1 flagellar export chaperone FliS [Dasania sp. GY-MA-18]MCZ0863809.1 flagellar export chaperone FliS [Dasania phycosphaerae]MCZ0867537.1 flagellar export chaperone FliS [Dasania phycosphaerae]
MSLKKGLNQYQKVSNQEAVSGVSPHRLIQLLMEGGLQRMAEGKGAMLRGDIAQKGVSLGKAISIIGGLSDSLNMDVEGGLPENLASLYDYMVQCLMRGNADNDERKIDEAIKLLRTIKSGWDGIAAEVA